jgi:hypothetical protein
LSQLAEQPRLDLEQLLVTQADKAAGQSH